MRLRAQLLAALCASALQNVTTVRSRHALTESVHLAALSLFGLIGTYHILHLFLPNIVMAHNAKLTFPIIEEAPPKCQGIFFAIENLPEQAAFSAFILTCPSQKRTDFRCVPYSRT